ncbi:MAG: hypothetical protein JYX80_06895 [Candidatus Scalindua sediminis]|nr:hypothetical protein [Candidatus Scalindua sediminis]HDY67585.1 hypothetical protein [Candidatus Scalindua sp.]
MPKRTSKKQVKKPEDINILAKSIFDKAISEGKNPAAVVLGKLGGLKGGKARAAKLTKRRRVEIASMAAKARWKKEK